ncbi:MAG TPA: rhodanese-like domain-containing protein [Methylomirabilota bacterium]|nr:rhodanese-like domain-containing protein [Methylomirabilota bacterium]
MAPGAISPEQLAALLEQPTPHAVLDVRERAAFERGHIYRATPLPRRLLEVRLPTLVTAPATLIVLYDDDGSLSALTAPTLTEMGYTEVFELTGGLEAWRRAGRPVVQGLNVPSKVFGERVLHEFKTPEITCLELHRRMADGQDLVIVDTRTPEEYARGCLPGAVSMPGGELVLRIGELVQRPDQTIVVHCGGRTRSYLGAESLRRMGLPNPIVAVRNGTMGWQLDGLELERGARRWPPAPSPQSRARALEVTARVAAEDGTPLVSPEAVAERWSRRHVENVMLFDVRTREEYEAGHVPGSLWVPGGQAVQATDDFMAVRSAWLVLICDGFGRSIMTAGWLKRMGFPHVAVLEGGLPAWVRAGRALETGEPATTPAGYEAARRVVERVPPGPPGDAVVLSVDPSDVYQRGHVPGARWIGRGRLELRIGLAAADKSRSLLVTCADGVQSTLAAATLRRIGYAAARVLDGGLAAWRAAGLPVETGPGTMLDEPDDVVQKPYERGRAAMEAYLRWEEALDQHGMSPHRLLPDPPAANR